jgi:CMP/dCMP kinase
MEGFLLKSISIAIDGPSGAGKSTIAKMIAKMLQMTYLDTGAMYRAVALKVIREGIGTKDKNAIAQVVEDIKIEIKFIKNEQHIFLDGEDVSDEIRTPLASVGASDVSAVPAVRIKMVDLQRQIAKGNSVVMDGRDIGTYVLPDAQLKIFLTASVDERAKRRYNELVGKGNKNVNFEDVKKDIEYRDYNDSHRHFAPLKKAIDAIEIESTEMTIDDVAQKIISLLKERKL